MIKKKKEIKTQQVFEMLDNPVPQSAVQRIPFTLEFNQEVVIGTSGTIQPFSHDAYISGEHCCVSFKVGGQTWLTNISGTPYTFRKIRPGQPIGITTEYFAVGSSICRIKDNVMLEVNQTKLNRVLQLPLTYTQGATNFLSRGLVQEPNTQTLAIEDDGSISFKHAKIQFNYSVNMWELTDHGRTATGSTNGTFVQVGSETILVAPQDTFMLGSSLFMLFY
jgi:hypothetical protein